MSAVNSEGPLRSVKFLPCIGIMTRDFFIDPAEQRRVYNEPMKRILIVIVLLGGLGVAGLMAAARSPVIVGAVLQLALDRAAGKASGAQVRIGTVVYAFPDDWTLGDVQVSLALKTGPVRITVREGRLTHALSLLRDGDSPRFNCGGGTIAFGALKAEGVEIVLAAAGLGADIHYTGRAAIAQVSWDKVAVTALKASVSGGIKEVLCRDLTAAAYGGLISGTVRASLGAPVSYEADVSVNNVDPGVIAAALGGVFNDLLGGLSGKFHITGRGTLVDGLDTGWSMPAGGKISASLLAVVMSYIPATTQKARVEKIIARNGKIAVEVFGFTIRNDRPGHFSGEIGIRSREANLELNVTHDVNVDGRLDELLKAWKTVFR